MEFYLYAIQRSKKRKSLVRCKFYNEKFITKKLNSKDLDCKNIRHFFPEQV